MTSPEQEFVPAYAGPATVILPDARELLVFAQLFCQEMPREKEPVNPDWVWYGTLTTTPPDTFLEAAGLMLTLVLPDGRRGEALFAADQMEGVNNITKSGPFPQ